MFVAKFFGVFERCKRVGGLAGLGDDEYERTRINGGCAIAIFAGDFDICRYAGNGFEPVSGRHASI